MDAHDASGEPFNEGDLVVYPGQGLCRVVGQQEIAGKPFLMLQVQSGAGMKLGLPVSQAASMLKRPMPRAEAEAAFAELLRTDLEPDSRSGPYRLRDAMKALSRGPSSARITELQKLYRSPYKPSFDEAKLLGVFEDVVLTELASALETTVEALKEKLAEVHPLLRGEVEERPEEPPVELPRPPAPFELPAHEYLGAFTVEETLVVAEPGATLSSADQPPEEDVRHNAHVKVKPGKYLAFVRTDENMQTRGALIAVHEHFADQLLTLAHDPYDLVRVIVEGSRIAMLDAAVRTEPAFIDEMEFPVFPQGLILDRGCMCSTGRDGLFEVKIARPLGETAFVMVEY